MKTSEATKLVVDIVTKIRAIGNREQKSHGTEGSRNYAMALTFCLGEHIANAFAGDTAQRERIFVQLREIAEGPKINDSSEPDPHAHHEEPTTETMIEKWTRLNQEVSEIEKHFIENELVVLRQIADTGNLQEAETYLRDNVPSGSVAWAFGRDTLSQSKKDLLIERMIAHVETLATTERNSEQYVLRKKEAEVIAKELRIIVDAGQKLDKDVLIKSMIAHVEARAKEGGVFTMRNHEASVIAHELQAIVDADKQNLSKVKLL